MKPNQIITLLAIVIIVGSGAFYGGLKYGQSQKVNFRDGNQMAQRFGNGQGGPAGAGQGAGAGRMGGNFIAGEIIAKDDKSITVKLNDGGSKIAFFSEATEVGQFATTTVGELSIGKNVMVSGKTNTDGSVSATSIQIRPLIAAPLK